MIDDLLNLELPHDHTHGMTTQEVQLLEYALLTETSAFYITTSTLPAYEPVRVYNHKQNKEVNV